MREGGRDGWRSGVSHGDERSGRRLELASLNSTRLSQRRGDKVIDCRNRSATEIDQGEWTTEAPWRISGALGNTVVVLLNRALPIESWPADALPVANKNTTMCIKLNSVCRSAINKHQSSNIIIRSVGYRNRRLVAQSKLATRLNTRRRLAINIADCACA